MELEWFSSGQGVNDIFLEQEDREFFLGQGVRGKGVRRKTEKITAQY